MAYDPESDERLDPRLKAILALVPVTALGDVTDRDTLLAQALTSEAKAAQQLALDMTAFLDTEEVAPSAGLDISEVTITSAPDGNEIVLRVLRPTGASDLAAVYYIHGGGMANGSVRDPIYRAWAKVIAAKGVAVVMVEFRNSLVPNTYEVVAPFPAGLNDCVSGLRWTHENASSLGLDASRIVLAGESGGGNLAIAVALSLKASGELSLIKGIYALCPYLVGKYPDDRYPSTVENNGILIDGFNNRGILAYGIDEFDAKNPLAWPDFATVADFKGFPPTVINVNECDPLRDEGVALYRKLLEAGVSARGRVRLGTFHGADLATAICPEISHETALDLATFAIA